MAKTNCGHQPHLPIQTDESEDEESDGNTPDPNDDYDYQSDFVVKDGKNADDDGNDYDPDESSSEEEESFKEDTEGDEDEAQSFRSSNSSSGDSKGGKRAANNINLPRRRSRRIVRNPRPHYNDDEQMEDDFSSDEYGSEGQKMSDPMGSDNDDGASIKSGEDDSQGGQEQPARQVPALEPGQLTIEQTFPFMVHRQRNENTAAATNNTANNNNSDNEEGDDDIKMYYNDTLLEH